jgi:nitroreductase
MWGRPEQEERQMELNEAIAHRRSVRAYTAEAVDEGTIARLIQAATLAPSAMNEQPWTFTVVRDQATLDSLSRKAKAHMLASLPQGETGDHFRSLLGSPDFQIFYHAPALIVISAASDGDWVVPDCALAAENLMLAAHAAGLGACWIGFAQSYLGTPEGKALLDIPAAWVPVAPIILGRPDGEPPAVPRKPPVVRWIG